MGPDQATREMQSVVDSNSVISPYVFGKGRDIQFLGKLCRTEEQRGGLRKDDVEASLLAMTEETLVWCPLFQVDWENKCYVLKGWQCLCNKCVVLTSVSLVIADTTGDLKTHFDKVNGSSTDAGQYQLVYSLAHSLRTLAGAVPGGFMVMDKSGNELDGETDYEALINSLSAPKTQKKKAKTPKKKSPHSPSLSPKLKAKAPASPSTPKASKKQREAPSTDVKRKEKKQKREEDTTSRKARRKSM